VSIKKKLFHRNEQTYLKKINSIAESKESSTHSTPTPTSVLNHSSSSTPSTTASTASIQHTKPAKVPVPVDPQVIADFKVSVDYT